MDKSSRTLTKWRDESGTPGSSGSYKHKVTLYCTCLFLHRPRLRRKNRRKNQKELNFSTSFTMPVPHAALLHFRRVPRRGPGCVSFRLGRRPGGGLGVFVARELWRRQHGFGRGGRMKIETDRARFLSGVHHGKTIGSPIAVMLENRDWQNWKEALPVETGDPETHKRVGSPQPGHADLAGALKDR